MRRKLIKLNERSSRAGGAASEEGAGINIFLWEKEGDCDHRESTPDVIDNLVRGIEWFQLLIVAILGAGLWCRPGSQMAAFIAASSLPIQPPPFSWLFSPTINPQPPLTPFSCCYKIGIPLLKLFIYENQTLTQSLNEEGFLPSLQPYCNEWE